MATQYLDKTGLAYLWNKIKTYVTNAVKVTGVKGNAEGSYRTGNVNLTPANIGAAASSHTHPSSDITWPSYKSSPVNDRVLMPLVSSLRANRFAFLPADQIIIEKTTDGGNTWVDAGISDATKVGLFSETREGIFIPLLNGVKSLNCGLRVTFTAMKYNVPSGTAETDKYQYWSAEYVRTQERYAAIEGLYFWVSTNSDTISVKLEAATGANPNSWSTRFNTDSFWLTGWSGNDFISVPYGVFGGGTNQTTNFWNYRLTFMTRGVNGTSTMATTYTTAGQSIMEIRGYGPSWWGKANEYMASDHLYAWDRNKNATFPAQLTATQFNGPLNGSASKVNNHTVNSDVPANAVFTDTTYSAATQSASGLMSASDKTKLDGVATGATANTGTITGITTTSPLSGSGTSGSVALSHANSGVTAASKGDTSNQTPGFGGTFKALSGTVNATGHLTAFAEHTVKIPDAVATASTPGLMSAGDKGLLDAFSTLVNTDKVSFDGSLLTISNLTSDTDNDVIHYGECSTLASTAAKTVELYLYGVEFKLVTGAWIAVKFEFTNTAAVANLTLNVSSTGAKSIKYRNANLPSAGTLGANHIYFFVYDGTYWQIIGDLDTDTTYSNATSSAAGLMSASDKKKLDLAHYGTCSVAGSTKTVACTNFVLETGAWIAVKFTVTNTATSFTLNVNSTGAKSVSLYGSSSGLANKFLSGHTYLFIYDGTYWQAVGDIDSGTTYSTMTQTQATAGTGTTGLLISPKVLSDTIADRAEYVAGDTLSITTGMICQGTIPGAASTLSFFVPFSKVCKATSCSCTDLSLLVRSYDGLPYARSGSSGGTYTRLGTGYVSVWENSASKRTNEVVSITCTPQDNGMMVQINWKYDLAKTSGNTAAVTLQRPAAVSIQGEFTFS